MLFLWGTSHLYGFSSPVDTVEQEHPGTKFHHLHFKTAQGVTFNRILDQKMSNLHYTGPGFVLGLGLRHQTPRYYSELALMHFELSSLLPSHQSTNVVQPVAGVHFEHLRNYGRFQGFNLSAGLKAHFFGDFRIAPELGNSYLYMDAIGKISPAANFTRNIFFLREWEVEIGLSAALTGYGLRFPQYGTSYRLDDDGGISLQDAEGHFLHPFNYQHFTTRLFLNESIGGPLNPNWLRIGYIWDYYSLSGKNGLSVYNASHHLVLELYFKIN